MSSNYFDLEERFIKYTCLMIDIVESLDKTRTGNYIASQLIRSCHSPTFNYGEVQAAESRNDFIHKMGIILKELKECRIALKIIIAKNISVSDTNLSTAISETEQLISIIAKSISTAKENNKRKS